VLDVTLTSGSLLGAVCDWFVDSQESSCDHKYIRCKLSLGPQVPVQIRNRRKTDWALYGSLVDTG
jgi:hypothetical protein